MLEVNIEPTAFCMVLASQDCFHGGDSLTPLDTRRQVNSATATHRFFLRPAFAQEFEAQDDWVQLL